MSSEASEASGPAAPDREETVRIEPATGARDLSFVRALFEEYAGWLGVDLCFQGFESELATLPGLYTPPRGGLWLAQRGGAPDGVLPGGVIGLRPLPHREGEHDAAPTGEIKRLWVRPSARGHGIGRRLIATALAAARRAGYARLVLDTLPSMAAAGRLYRQAGFVEIPPYYANPIPETVYLGMDLGPGGPPPCPAAPMEGTP